MSSGARTKMLPMAWMYKPPQRRDGSDYVQAALIAKESNLSCSQLQVRADALRIDDQQVEGLMQDRILGSSAFLYKKTQAAREISKRCNKRWHTAVDTHW